MSKARILLQSKKTLGPRFVEKAAQKPTKTLGQMLKDKKVAKISKINGVFLLGKIPGQTTK